MVPSTSTPPVLTGTRRRDAGFTLVETIVVVAMIALVAGAISAAVIVILRSESSVTTAVGDNHDIQQAVNYFHLDVESGPARVGQWSTNAGAGCATAGSENLFRYDTLDLLRYDDESGRRIAYRLVDDGTTTRIDRYACALDTSGNWIVESIVNIADRLPSTPAAAAVAITSSGGLVDDVTMTFDQSISDRSITATPRPESGLATVPEQCGPDPFAATLGFQNFASGDVTLNSGALEGSLAVGGTLAWDDGTTPGQIIPVASSNTNSANGFSSMALYASVIDWTPSGMAGRLTTQTGSSKKLVLGPNWMGSSPDWHFVDGGPGNPSENPDTYWWNATAAGAPGANDSIATQGTVLPLGSPSQPVIDFGNQLSVLQDCSDALAALPKGAIAEHVTARATDGSPFTGGTLEITFEDDPLGDQATAVLNIPEAVLATITAVQRTSGSSLNTNRPLIVNIIEDPADADSDVTFDFSTTDWASVGDEKFVVFNFPNTTGTITVVQDSYGAILAPYAAEVITGGSLRAQVATTNWTHNGGIVESGNEHKFSGSVAWL